MQTPLVVSEMGDIDLFETVREAEVYLEPIDVENDEYEAFDASGRRLILDVVNEVLPGKSYPVRMTRIRLDEAIHDPSVDRLAKLLREYLAGAEDDFLRSAGDDLPTLIARVHARVGFTR